MIPKWGAARVASAVSALGLCKIARVRLLTCKIVCLAFYPQVRRSAAASVQLGKDNRFIEPAPPRVHWKRRAEITVLLLVRISALITGNR